MAAPPATVTPLAPTTDISPVPLPPPGQQQPPPQAPQTTEGPENPQPNAVEKFAKQTGEAITDTGAAVGNAAKKTWDCVASLFGDC